MKVLLNQPAWAVMGVLGILLLMLFRPGKPLIGYSQELTAVTGLPLRVKRVHDIYVSVPLA